MCLFSSASSYYTSINLLCLIAIETARGYAGESVGGLFHLSVLLVRCKVECSELMIGLGMYV